MTLILDRITGKPAIIQGEGIPWIPGAANSLTSADLGLPPGLAGREIPFKTVAARIETFLSQYSNLFGVRSSDLILNLRRSGPVLDYLYYADFYWTYYGIPVESTHLTFRMNHGNLIQVGQNFICAIILELDPHPYLTRESAWAILWDYIGGNLPGDTVVQPGRLGIIPISTPEVLAGQLVAPGTGLKYRLVYAIAFQRPGTIGSWEARVDAHSGELLSFRDTYQYGNIRGGVYKSDPNPTPIENTAPFPLADYGASLYADSAGNFPGVSGTCTMSGPVSGIGGYPGGVKINDACGSITKTADGSGLIDFGSGSGTDCAVPSGQSVGDTHAARTAYWHMTQMKIKGLSYFPTGPAGPYSWLQSQLLVKVNALSGTKGLCLAQWTGSYAEFYRSDDSLCPSDRDYYCNNYGEIPSVIIHEWAHGLDQFDQSGVTEPSTREANADFTAALQTHNSCFAQGAHFSTCLGYGDPCKTNAPKPCLGRRDMDYMAHNSTQAWDVGFLAAMASQSCECDPDPPALKGPCNFEAYCESGIISQALWDLAMRAFPASGMDQASSWQLMDRLWYASRNTAKNAYACTSTCGNSPSTAADFDGSLYHVLRAADDCDGDLSNGTPHAAAIFDALNAHGIAGSGVHTNQTAPCADPGCLALGKLALNGSAASCYNALNWGSVPNASRYIVYRNEVSCDAGFTKIGSTSSTSFQDMAVAAGSPYFYQIQAARLSDDCAGPVSNCAQITAVPCGACTPPGAPNLVSVVGTCEGVNLSWAPGAGTTLTYNVYRKTAPCGGTYEKIAGPLTVTTYKDTSASMGTSYAYVVTGSCGNSANGQSNYSNCLSAARLAAPVAPYAPNLNYDCNGISVGWNAVSGATSYNVLRRNDGCGEKGWNMAMSGLINTHWIDTATTKGETYGYYIQACNASCCGGSVYNCASRMRGGPCITGRVTETRHDRTTDPPTTSTEGIDSVIVKDEISGIIKTTQTIGNEPGYYRFEEVQPGDYHLHAYKGTTQYNPLPYRSITVTTATVQNQDFWLSIYVIPFTGRLKYPIFQGGTLDGFGVTAVSAGYETTTTTDAQGNYTLLLPVGSYQIAMRKDCYVAYPGYLGVQVGAIAMKDQDFLLTGWAVCDNCYATLFEERRLCGGLIGGREECELGADRKFHGCALAKTLEARSSLYNATLLSVQVHRSAGQPQLATETFTVVLEGDYFINITSGDHFNTETAVSSAEISMAPFGTLFSPSDFNKNEFLLKKQVHLTPGEYSISSILRSQPGSYLTIVISDRDIASFPELP